MRLVDPVDVLAEEPVKQIDGAIRAAALFGALVAVHLVDGDHGGKHDIALEVLGVEIDAEQCHLNLPSCGRRA